VSNKPGHRGEHEVSRKTIARGMPGDFRCDRGDYARVLFTLHARLRAHRAPGIPCALCNKRTGNSGKTRAQSRGEIAKPCLYAAGCLKCEVGKLAPPSLRANGSRECAPDDRLREAIHSQSSGDNGLLRRFAPRNDGSRSRHCSLRGAQATKSYPSSFRDGPKDQTSDVRLHIAESRDSGFDASHRPGMT